jgi:pyruvate/2-oxoglutarate dehydrogenase complex dihydrolipoamide acyltransferase (E2) component
VRVVRPLVVFWLDDSEEVPLNKHAMDVDTAETLAGVVRLIRQAAVLAWAAADRAAAGSAAQLFALGVDLAADQARHLVPDGADIDGPVPVGDEPAGLLRSAELLLRRLEPARRGLVNAATEVAAATNQAVAAAAHLSPAEQAPRERADRARRVGRVAREREIPVRHPNRGGRPR